MAVEAVARKPFHEVFAEQIIEDLKQGAAPWQKPWQPGELFPPMNPVSGTVYSGINRLMLSRNGYADPRWMTLRQANSIDCRVRKGEKSQPIVYWQFTKDVPAKDEQGKPVLDADGKQVMEKVQLTRPIVRFSSVFHVSQLEGHVPPLDASTLVRTWDPNEKAEAILANSGAVIKHNQRSRAFYSPAKDEICLPPLEQFPTPGNYYSTALHELGHWTGHESRMAREFGPFGSEVYAREELRAEIASWMLGQDLGIGYDPGQHLSYVGSWIKVLEKDPYEIVRACRDAEKMKEFVLGMEHKQELKQEVSVSTRDAGGAPDIATEKTFLHVPFAEKGQARAAGAKWDADAKLWYAPEGADLARLDAWRTARTPEPVSPMDPRQEFAQALRSAGLDLGGHLPVMDGKMQRVPTLDGKPGTLDGAYIGHLDGHPAGWYQNHKTGEKTTWKATGHTLTPQQKDDLRREGEERTRQRQREREMVQDRVAEMCVQNFSALPPIASMAALRNPYLLSKGILPLGGVKESSDGKVFLVPLTNAEDKLRNVQEIGWGGEKRFQAGGEKQGCFFLLDPEKRLSQEPRGGLLLAEGYATGVSLHMATGKPVAVAFDAGNLEPVAKILREKFPDARIAICADNDHKHENNVGVEKAKQAAKAINGCVIVPAFTSDEKEKGLTDFNDLHQARGLEAVKAQVSRVLETQKCHGMER